MAFGQICSCKQVRLKSTQIFIVATIIFITLIVTVFCVASLVRYEVENEVTYTAAIEYWDDDKAAEQALWYAKAIQELEVALHIRYKQLQQARNVIVFLTSGVDGDELAAIRFHENSKQAVNMAWDDLPHFGKLKNTCSHKERCDLTSIASSLFGGVKTNYMVSGFDTTIVHGNCSTGISSRHKIKGIIQQAVEQGLRTGFVTNQRVTGAVGAALYSHTTNTNWECDAAIPAGLNSGNCPDVATQLLTTKTGQSLNVILGGGRQTLVSNTVQTPLDIVDDSVCNSNDQRHYIRDWRKQKEAQRRRYVVLDTASDLKKLKPDKLDYVLGIFDNDDLIGTTLNTPMKQLPVQQDLVQLAIDTLQREHTGYLLVVETSMDQSTKWHKKLQILLALNDTMNYVLNSSENSNENLVLGVFTNGNYRQHLNDQQAEQGKAKDIFSEENEALLKERLAVLPSETLVFAKGPQAYLFHGVHEETYMAHVIANALKMGRYAEHKKANKNFNN